MLSKKQSSWRGADTLVSQQLFMATHVVGNCLLSQQKDSRSLVRSPDVDPQLDPDLKNLDPNLDRWSGA